MEYSGSRILIESLIELGVDTVFGYPGGAIINVYDELHQHKDRLNHILTAQEPGAAHAADGYARSSGKVGVCMATSGPGATNLVTGIATAYMDSVPIVAITANVPTNLLGKDSFQEVDIAGIMTPITKHAWIVKDVRDLASVIREAFFIAGTGRPGPVLIDIPKDVTAAKTEWVPLAKDPVAAVLFPSASPSPQKNSDAPADEDVEVVRARRLARRFIGRAPEPQEIAAAVKILAKAERPLLYIGGGVKAAGAHEEIKEMAERLNAPVVATLMGLGAFPSSHPLALGMVGMHGTKAANAAVQRADVIVALGARFSDRVVGRADLFAPTARILHIDIDEAEINKNIRSELGVSGEMKATLRAIMEACPNECASGWGLEMAALKRVTSDAENGNGTLRPKFIIEELHRRFGSDAIVATDVGQHQMWTALYYPFDRPRAFLTSGGLGTMGYGMGAALGAAQGNPDRQVVLVTGDGSFRMNNIELGTMVTYGLPVLIVLLNNHTLGMVRQWQTLFYEKRYSETTLEQRPPDFIALAKAYGLAGFRASDEASFIASLEAAAKETAAGRPALVECGIDIDEKVLPMVAVGKALDDQIVD